jgi:hypothetical protein
MTNKLEINNNFEGSLKEIKEELRLTAEKLKLAEKTISDLKNKPEAKQKYDLSHLTQTTQVVWGPIQDGNHKNINFRLDVVYKN